MTPDPAPLTDVAGDDALNARRAAILEAVVTENIGTAEPVGSTAVARIPGMTVSPATVRHEMGVLEHDGYLVQPHTSAGRIPTDKGYRFFVDHLVEPGVLGPAQRLRHSLLDSAAEQQAEPTLWPVIASRIAVDLRGAPHFSHHDDQG